MHNNRKNKKKNTIYQSLRKTRIFFTRLAKKIILPGFERISIYEVGSFFFKGIRKSSLISRANALSFTFLLALFPSIIFFFTLIPYIPVDNMKETVMETMAELMPHNVVITLQNTIQDLVNHQRSGLLSLGFFLAIYFSSNGVMGIMKAFNRSSHALETRSKLQLILISLVLVFVITLIIILTMSSLILSSVAIKYFSTQGYLRTDITCYLILIGRWIIIMAMIFSVISMIYYLAPTIKGQFKFISAGSTLATALSLVFIMVFNYYIENFSQYNRLYGSLGTIIILMLWVNMNAIVLLIGFELNASIYDAKLVKK